MSKQELLLQELNILKDIINDPTMVEKKYSDCISLRSLFESYDNFLRISGPISKKDIAKIAKEKMTNMGFIYIGSVFQIKLLFLKDLIISQDPNGIFCEIVLCGIDSRRKEREIHLTYLRNILGYIPYRLQKITIEPDEMHNFIETDELYKPKSGQDVPLCMEIFYNNNKEILDESILMFLKQQEIARLTKQFEQKQYTYQLPSVCEFGSETLHYQLNITLNHKAVLYDFENHGIDDSILNYTILDNENENKNILETAKQVLPQNLYIPKEILSPELLQICSADFSLEDSNDIDAKEVVQKKLELTSANRRCIY